MWAENFWLCNLLMGFRNGLIRNSQIEPYKTKQYLMLQKDNVLSLIDKWSKIHFLIVWEFPSCKFEVTIKFRTCWSVNIDIRILEVGSLWYQNLYAPFLKTTLHPCRTFYYKGHVHFPALAYKRLVLVHGLGFVRSVWKFNYTESGTKRLVLILSEVSSAQIYI